MIRDISGQKFGRLTAVKPVGRCPHRQTIWECRCECGETTQVIVSSLKSGNTRSCGCLQREAAKEVCSTRHGVTDHRLYRTWRHMRSRCMNPRDKSFANYGGRGITVDWTTYREFKEWAFTNGYRSDLSIDRIDNNGPYAPWNCRWVTKIVQANNTRSNRFIELCGQRMTVAEASRMYDIPYSRLLRRVKSGIPPEVAISAPVYVAAKKAVRA